MFNTPEYTIIPRIVDKCIKSVVDILVLKSVEDNRQENSLLLAGENFIKIGNSSGFFIDRSGIVVTNYHSLIGVNLVYKIHYNGEY